MRGLIPKRNHTVVTIAAKVFQHQATGKGMRGLIPKRNRTNVAIAAKVSRHQATRIGMRKFIPENQVIQMRKRSNVITAPCAPRVSQQRLTCTGRREVIRKRNF